MFLQLIECYMLNIIATPLFSSQRYNTIEMQKKIICYFSRHIGSWIILEDANYCFDQEPAENSQV